MHGRLTSILQKHAAPPFSLSLSIFIIMGLLFLQHKAGFASVPCLFSVGKCR